MGERFSVETTSSSKETNVVQAETMKNTDELVKQRRKAFSVKKRLPFILIGNHAFNQRLIGKPGLGTKKLFLCLRSELTLDKGRHFFLVSMPGEPCR